MRRLKSISALCILALCVGCAPQKRLALLLARHPELQHDTALVVSKQMVRSADSAYIHFTLADLRGMASDTCLPEQSRPHDNDLTVETPSGASATISAMRQDCYRLQVRTRTDTIHLCDTITVPAYTTRVEYRDKIVHTLSPAQSFFFWVGIIALALVALSIILRVVIRFVKL